MASTDRQNRLLVAEDWRKIYQSFQQADFKSYDFETLRRTMVAYLRENYPDDFNDFVESSEYVALIDLIAYVAQALSFRVDLNARENFLETASRRNSVLRLARLISYNASRNQPATGLLKIDSISSGSLTLDGALGVGGYPKGRVIEIYGPESSGKTTLTLHAIAECQKAGGIAAFIDA